MSTPTSTLPRKRQPRRSVCRSNVSSRRLISWWSGATPPRSRPHGVGSRSNRSISASPRGPQQAGGGERPGRPGADDRHPRSRAGHQAAVRSAVLRLGEELRVELQRVVVLLGHLEVGEDRVDRAGLDAGVAVDADLGIDVELLRGLEVGRPRLRMDAVDGADLDAGVVLDAAAGDDVGHGPTGYIRGKPGAFQGIGPGRHSHFLATSGMSVAPALDGSWRRWSTAGPRRGRSAKSEARGCEARRAARRLRPVRRAPQARGPRLSFFRWVGRR